MTGMGIHLTDLYISYFGPVKTVQALTANRVLDWETGDVVTVQLMFEAGMTATLSGHLCGADDFLGRKPGRRLLRLSLMGDCYVTVSR